jgi:hypothetical protein
VAGSRGYACADGPLAGQVLMLSETTMVGSLWTVTVGDGTYTYRYTGTGFDFVSSNSDAESPSAP